jgi:tetratricopeptide (TPR) repeat protein
LPLREQVAKALLYKGLTLEKLDRREEAIAVYDDLLARFGGANELPLREQVAKVLLRKGLTLEKLGTKGSTLDRGELVTDFYRHDRSAPFFKLPLRADPPFAKGGPYDLSIPFDSANRSTLRTATARGGFEEAIAVYDDLLARFGSANELPLRVQVAKALYFKASALKRLSRHEEAFTVYDDSLARFGSATELPLRKEVADMLYSKALTYGGLGRSREEIVVYDDLLARFGSAAELPLREVVAKAKSERDRLRKS